MMLLNFLVISFFIFRSFNTREREEGTMEIEWCNIYCDIWRQVDS
jgi:hypothetical protein